MTILIGYPSTPEGEAALATGLHEAARREEDVVLLRSPRRGGRSEATSGEDASDPGLVARADALGVTATIEATEPAGDLVDAFRECAARHHASLVVIGLRRRSPVGKLVMGSSAQRLLLELDVPVLAVKPVP